MTTEKRLELLGSEWKTEGSNYRMECFGGDFMRLIQCAVSNPKDKGWVIACFRQDGTGYSAVYFASFKKVLESLKESN